MNERSLPAMPPPSDTLWSRLNTTPLSDVMHGRLTASLDLRRVIAAANLPEPLPSLIYQTVRRTRLWRSKRLDAARELINRFQNDLGAGRAPDELVVAFGDPVQAARLIRREKGIAAFWRRLAKTSLRDVLRDWFTAGPHVRRAIAAAALAQPLADFIYLVARRTRLWRAERVDVARELAEHFRDGTNAGRTPEELIKSFGDPRQAALLIRRAKLRSRPWAWRAWRRAKQAAGALIALAVTIYLFYFIRFVIGNSRVSHNYGLELNAPARATPEGERAWPLYREALLQMTPEPRIVLPPDATWTDDERSFWAATEKPSGKHWGLVATWLMENRAPLRIIRHAASRAHLGFVFGDPADRPWLEKRKTDPKSFDLSGNPPVFNLKFDELQELREISILLEADAHRALAQNDGETFIRDVEAAVGLAGQTRDGTPFLAHDLMSFAILLWTLEMVDDMLAEQPELLHEADLKRLAHCIAGYAGGGTIRCRLAGSRLGLRDLYQRIYTDDGRGDGRVTPEGLRLLIDLRFLPQANVNWAEAPVLSALIASRRKMSELTEHFYDRLESAISRPLWESTKLTMDDLKQSGRSPLDRIRYAPLVAESSLVETAFYGERVTQQRDVTLVVLALELYRRRNDSWPKNLAELVPDLLPAVPPDRFTGGPLLYRIVDGRPILYSAGPDRKDDGGRSVKNPDQIRLCPPAAAGAAESRVPDGDWILWPPPQKKDARQ